MQPTSADRALAGRADPPNGCSVRWFSLARPAASRGPVAVVVDFEPGDFSDDLFGVHGIACPEVIRHSGRKRQGEFFFGRWAARLALQALGAPTGEIPIGRRREPVWPVGMTGSISHTDRVAVACACPVDSVAGIGIDVERIPALEVLEEIELLTLSAAEKSLLNGLAAAHPEAAPGLFPTLLFSVKEALFKALSGGPGRPLDFKDVVLTRIDLPDQQIELRFAGPPPGDRAPGPSLLAFFKRLDDAVVLTFFSWK